MGAIDLNKVAVSMGKVLKSLSELEPKIRNVDSLEEHKETLFVLAYMCRIGLLDRIENNTWMKMEVPIRIPTGLFSSRKETISTGLMLTVGKLKEIVVGDIEMGNIIESILDKQEAFYELEKILPSNFKDKL